MTHGGFPKDLENAAVYVFAKKTPFFFAEVNYFLIRKESFLGSKSKSYSKIKLSKNQILLEL